MRPSNFFARKQTLLETPIPFLKEMKKQVQLHQDHIQAQIKINQSTYDQKVREASIDDQLATIQSLPGNSEEAIKEKLLAFEALRKQHQSTLKELESNKNKANQALQNSAKNVNDAFTVICKQWRTLNLPTNFLDKRPVSRFLAGANKNTQGLFNTQHIEHCLQQDNQLNLEQLNTLKNEYVNNAKTAFNELKHALTPALYAEYLGLFFYYSAQVLAITGLIVLGAPALAVALVACTIILPMMMNISAAAGGGRSFEQFAREMFFSGVNLGGTLLLSASASAIASIVLFSIATAYDTKVAVSKERFHALWNEADAEPGKMNPSVSIPDELFESQSLKP